MRRNLRCNFLKNVRRHKRGEKVYKYHRRTGARLPDLPEDNPQFIAAWLAEEHSAPTRHPQGSLAAECAAYLRSEGFRTLSRDYARIIETHTHAIAQSYPEAPADRIQSNHIQIDLDRLPGHKSNARLKAWRLLCKYMKSRHGYPDASAGIGRKQTPRTEGHAPVTLDQFEAYRDRWAIGTPQRLAGELLFWTGARVSDAVKLSPAMVGRDGLLTFRQEKTNNPAHVPWLSALPEWAIGWDADRATLHKCLDHCKGFTFLETHQGKARSKKGLSNLISGAFAETGIHRTAHGFRKTRLTLIAEAGGSTQAIMSWGGHVTLAEAEEYTRSAERRTVLLVNTKENRVKS